MSKLRSAFKEYLDELLLEGIEYLRQHGWLDKTTLGPNIELIEPLILPYLGEQTALPENIQGAINRGARIGTANELLGNVLAAKAWYGVGQYAWRGKRIFAKDMDNPAPDEMTRSAAARPQLESAICATRVGNHERARQLYEWAALNYGFSETERQSWEDKKDKTHIVLWINFSYRAYALLCLGRWAEALAAAEQGQEYLRRDRHWKDETYTPVVLYPIVQAVARCKCDPRRRIGAKQLRCFRRRRWPRASIRGSCGHCFIFTICGPCTPTWPNRKRTNCRWRRWRAMVRKPA